MTLKRKVGDKAKVAKEGSHSFPIGSTVTIMSLVEGSYLNDYYAESNSIGWYVNEDELADIEPLTPDEFYQKTRQLVRLQTLVEQIDETDTTSGADFLDEVKRLIEEIKVQLGINFNSKCEFCGGSGEFSRDNSDGVAIEGKCSFCEGTGVEKV